MSAQGDQGITFVRAAGGCVLLWAVNLANLVNMLALGVYRSLAREADLPPDYARLSGPTLGGVAYGTLLASIATPLL